MNVEQIHKTTMAWSLSLILAGGEALLPPPAVLRGLLLRNLAVIDGGVVAVGQGGDVVVVHSDVITLARRVLIEFQDYDLNLKRGLRGQYIGGVWRNSPPKDTGNA